MHVYDWLSDFGHSGEPPGYSVFEVSFKGGRRGFFRNQRDLPVQTGDYVLVQADRGMDFGAVHMSGDLVRLRVKSKGVEDESSLPTIVRKATASDVDRWAENQIKEQDSFLVGRKAIEKRNMAMKLVDVEWQFDHKKVTFYFTAETRVDFRELVRDLARRFHTRVELRQIGARDEAARIGGIGSCGRELCCSTWLQAFKPVTTQAAKVQNLPLNPARLSGQCGRLKCCLNYELEQYMSTLQRFPRLDTAIETPRGVGRVKKLDIFKDMVWVLYPNGMWDEVPLDEARQLMKKKGGRGSRGASKRDEAEA